MPFCVSARVVAVLYMCAILQAQCRSLYRHPLTCEPGEYYNRATHHCEGCAQLCQPQRDTLAQCSQLCPGFTGYQITPIPDTPLSTTEPTSLPVADMKKKKKDEEFESSIWWSIYGLVATLAVIAPVTIILVFCGFRLLKQNKKLMKLLDYEERPLGNQAVATQTDNPPRQAAPPSAPPTTAPPPEVQPLLTDLGKPVSEEGLRDEVPTAPSKQVSIYANDTTPHDRNRPLMEAQGTAPKILETVC